jgi:hypothetical protein
MLKSPKTVSVFLAGGLALLAWASPLRAADAAPASQPSQSPDAASEAVRLGQLRLLANQAMARGDYSAALPQLQKVSQMLTDQPDQLGPVLEDIRVCRRQIATGGKPIAPQMVTVPDSGQRVPHATPASGQVLELAIKDLGNFDYDAENGGNIPADVKRLQGCQFQTTGFMIPLDQAESISEFALVPSLFACCYGQPPQIQHTIVVHCPKGKAISYFPDELTVRGTLHVEEQKDGGFIVSIFQLDASSVRASAK